jgi:hypothetical protein
MAHRQLSRGGAIARNSAALGNEDPASCRAPLASRRLLDAENQTLPAAYEQAASLMESALLSEDHRGVQAFREPRLTRFAPLP